jgi:hypothetical protein
MYRGAVPLRPCRASRPALHLRERRRALFPGQGTQETQGTHVSRMVLLPNIANIATVCAYTVSWRTWFGRVAAGAEQGRSALHFIRLPLYRASTKAATNAAARFPTSATGKSLNAARSLDLWYSLLAISLIARKGMSWR